jgi:hypothetical protein
VAVDWTLSDAWIFAAVTGTGRADGTSLRRLISYADAINHAIPTEAELVEAVSRLRSAGLVEADIQEDRYWLTVTGHRMHQKHLAGHGLFGWIEAIPPALRTLGEPPDGDWSLPSGIFDRAVRAYLSG